MLRQILSPSPEIGDASTIASCCSLLQPSIFSNYPMMLSSTFQIPPQSSSPYHTAHASSLLALEQPSFDHVQIHIESHPCQSCGLEFRSVAKLNYHVRTSHPIHGRHDVNETHIKYSCALCPRTFPTLSHLRMHEMAHSPLPIANQTSQANSGNAATNSGTESTFGCDRCPASFRYRTLLERHKRIHNGGQDKPYSCSRCLMRFETRNLYNHHAKTHKPSTSGNSLIYTTDIPGVATNLNDYPASTSANSIANNTVTMSNEPAVSYPCDSCSKIFLTIESLTTHKAVHRSRPLVCDVCGKGFTHRKYYVVHQRIHTGERPYLCAMCGKSFTQASTLTVHRRYHTGERPYTCTLCGKGFVTRTIMLNHMKKHWFLNP